MSSSMPSCPWASGCWLADAFKCQGLQTLLGDDGGEFRAGGSLVRLLQVGERAVLGHCSLSFSHQPLHPFRVGKDPEPVFLYTSTK